MDLDKIKTMAKAAGFTKMEHQPATRMISFAKGDKEKGDWVRINVYYTTGTVATCLNHPEKGRTQLFRRDCSYRELEKILNHPRVHTQKGYYTK